MEQTCSKYFWFFPLVNLVAPKLYGKTPLKSAHKTNYE